MAGVTRKQAKGRVLAAWADDDWWRGEPIATGVTTEVGDARLIEVVLKAYADATRARCCSTLRPRSSDERPTTISGVRLTDHLADG